MPQTNRSEKGIGYIGLAIILAILIVGFCIFDGTHFLRGTTIAEIDSSQLTLQQATSKFEQVLKERSVKFYFMSGSIYEESYEQIGAKVDEQKLKEIFKEQHLHRMERRFYNLGSIIEFDQKKLQEFLNTLPELKPENMTAPQNACVMWNGKTFGVTKEKVGNQIDLEEAKKFTMRQVNAGMDSVYFQLVTNAMPDVVDEDAESMKEYLNNLLQSCLNFHLANGEVVTLDENTIKTWIVEDSRLGYSADVENGVESFIKMLAKKVVDANKSVPEFANMELNEKVETEVINSFLGNAEPQELDIAYRRIPE